MPQLQFDYSARRRRTEGPPTLAFSLGDLPLFRRVVNLYGPSMIISKPARLAYKELSPNRCPREPQWDPQFDRRLGGLAAILLVSSKQ